MKKITAIIMAALLVLSLAGCSKEESGSDNNSSNNESSSTNESSTNGSGSTTSTDTGSTAENSSTVEESTPESSTNEASDSTPDDSNIRPEVKQLIDDYYEFFKTGFYDKAAAAIDNYTEIYNSDPKNFTSETFDELDAELFNNANEFFLTAQTWFANYKGVPDDIKENPDEAMTPEELESYKKIQSDLSKIENDLLAKYNVLSDKAYGETYSYWPF